MLNLAKQELLEGIKHISVKLKGLEIYCNEKGLSCPSLGYFFDKEKEKWIVFGTTEHCSMQIYLETTEEFVAVLKLYKKVSMAYEAQERNRQLERKYS